MNIITFPKICKQLVVYQFYCMELFHSQTQGHIIIQNKVLLLPSLQFAVLKKVVCYVLSSLAFILLSKRDFVIF